MPTISILCTGDIHLGRVSSKCLAETDEAAPYTARAAWARVVEAAIERKVDLLLLSGDIADDGGNQYEAMGPFEAGVSRLAAQGIAVYMVAGNHDARVLPRLASMLQAGAVRLLGQGGGWEQLNWPPAGETPLLSLVGWSYPGGRVPVLPLDALSVQRQAAVPVIAIAHTDYRANSQDYAACTLAALRGVAGVDLWLLGHIHAPECLAGAPTILNPGSPQALDPGEPGVHGPWLVRIVEGKIGAIEQLPLSSVSYRTATVDISAMAAEDDLVAWLLPALGANHASRVSCRVTLSGRSGDLPRLTADVQRLLSEQPLLENHHLYLDQLDMTAIRPDYDLTLLAARADVIGALAGILQGLEQGDAADARTATYRHGARERMRQVLNAPAFHDGLLQDGLPDELALLTRECRRLLDCLLRQEEARV